MEANELKKVLTVENIILLVTEGLGSEGYLFDSAGNIIFQTICHNEPGEGKYKLYYYIDSQIFHCFTQCSASFDIYELVQKAHKANNFVEAFNYVLDFFGFSHCSDDLEEEAALSTDWDLLNKYSFYQEETPSATPSTAVLSSGWKDYYGHLIPNAWFQEGISIAAMQKYGISMDCERETIIIPHLNQKGELIGIRGRSFNWEDLEQGRKYIPVKIEQKWLNHPLGDNLYGLYFNQENIKKTRKAVIVEGEKSVLKAETYYPNNSFVVACCGSNISETQVNLLLSLGVNEIIIAFDKENDEFPGSEKSVKYLEKLKTLARSFTPYVNVYIVYDTDNLLDYKDSPFDKGKGVLETLMKNKILVPSISVEGDTKKARKSK